MLQKSAGSPLAGIRSLLLLLLALGLVGTTTDLLLLKHYESPWQVVPLVLLGLSVPCTAWFAFGSGATRIQLFRAIMALMTAAGILGLYFHYRGSLDFQTDTYPDLHGWSLFLKVVRSKAPPALAPGAMIQLGLLGLILSIGQLAGPSREPAPST